MTRARPRPCYRMDEECALDRSISLDDFYLWAKGLKKIAVYYDTPNNDLMGEF